MASVTVHGSAEDEVAPDRVRVTFTVEAEAAQSAQALGDLAERSAALDRIIDQAGEAVLLRRPSSISVSPAYGSRGEVRGQAARRTVTVVTKPEGVLGDLLARAVEVQGTTIGGMQWLVEPGNPIHARLRAEAVADARGRAQVYAEAAGMRLGQLEWIAEPGLGPGRPPPDQAVPMAQRMAFAATMEQGGGARVLDVKPEPVTVSAGVEIRFALLPGPVDREGGNYL